jgi:hypothetical protein
MRKPNRLPPNQNWGSLLWRALILAPEIIFRE